MADENYKFIKETVKEKPVNKKKTAQKFFISAGCGLVFAVVACLVGVFLYPKAVMLKEKIDAAIVEHGKGNSNNEKPLGNGSDGTGDVNGPSEEDISGMDNSDGGGDASGNGIDKPSANQAINQSGNSEISENPEGQGIDDAGISGNHNEPDSNTDSQNENPGADGAGHDDKNSTNGENKKSDIEKYQKMVNDIYAVGTEADKFVVAVTSVESEKDLFNDYYENSSAGYGIIIAKDEGSLFVLTEKSTVKGNSSITISFLDGTSVGADLVATDTDTGIAVLEVSAEEFDSEYYENIVVGQTDNTFTSIATGQTVIAVGAPQGNIHSMLMGHITYNANVVSFADCNYAVYSTDIFCPQNKGGVLVNTEGKIVGLILKTFSDASGSGTISAVSATEIKQVYNKLLTGEKIPYSGVRFSEVSDEISTEYYIPKGMYVREVDWDSPAMMAGIMAGDVITEVNGVEMLTESLFESTLRGAKAGEVTNMVIRRQSQDGYREMKITLVPEAKK